MRILLHGPQGSGKSSWGVDFINSMFNADWPERTEDEIHAGTDFTKEAPKSFIYTTTNRKGTLKDAGFCFDMVISIGALDAIRDNVVPVKRQHEFTDDLTKRVEEMGLELKDMSTASIVIAIQKDDGPTKMALGANGCVHDIGRALHEGLRSLGKSEPGVLKALATQAVIGKLFD